MKVAYIVGKISGLPLEEAKDNFGQKKKYLESQGYDEAITPFEVYKATANNFCYPLPIAGSAEEWRLAMSASILHICVLVFRHPNFELHALPNWKDSEGAKIEVELAQKLGIKVVLPPYTVRKKEVETPRNVHETAL